MIERVDENIEMSAEPEADRTLAERVAALEQQLSAMAARLGPAEPSPAARTQAEPGSGGPADEQIDQALARIDEFVSVLRDQSLPRWDAREAVLVRILLRDLASVVGHLQQIAGDSDGRVTAAHQELKAIGRQVDRGLAQLRPRDRTDEPCDPVRGEQDRA